MAALLLLLVVIIVWIAHAIVSNGEGSPDVGTTMRHVRIELSVPR
jgi:hypothetical protein